MVLQAMAFVVCLTRVPSLMWQLQMMQHYSDNDDIQCTVPTSGFLAGANQQFTNVGNASMDGKIDGINWVHIA